jgi:hypothetical protein
VGRGARGQGRARGAGRGGGARRRDRERCARRGAKGRWGRGQRRGGLHGEAPGNVPAERAAAGEASPNRALLSSPPAGDCSSMHRHRLTRSRPLPCANARAHAGCAAVAAGGGARLCSIGGRGGGRRGRGAAAEGGGAGGCAVQHRLHAADAAGEAGGRTHHPSHYSARAASALVPGLAPSAARGLAALAAKAAAANARRVQTKAFSHCTSLHAIPAHAQHEHEGMREALAAAEGSAAGATLEAQRLAAAVRRAGEQDARARRGLARRAFELKGALLDATARLRGAHGADRREFQEVGPRRVQGGTGSLLGCRAARWLSRRLAGQSQRANRALDSSGSPAKKISLARPRAAAARRPTGACASASGRWRRAAPRCWTRTTSTAHATRCSRASCCGCTPQSRSSPGLRGPRAAGPEAGWGG